MVKYRIWIKTVPQIAKDLMNQLYNSKATFEITVPTSSFFIHDLVHFTLDETVGEAMYLVRINTENNTKDIFIAKVNLLEFTVHFN